MLCTLCTKGVSPAFIPQQRLTLVMLTDKNTRNVCSLSAPSNHAARGLPAQDALARAHLWLTMMKPYLSANGHWDPKQADGNNSRQLALSPQRSDYPADEGWRWQEDIRAWANCHHVFSPMGFKCQKQNPPNPPNKTLPFLVCLASKPRSNPLQAQVAPN
ncbi:hypothetical protein O181_101632, partial [Austropuccinia psidii MF-1]|nr:hypothetical protein [Austropuccinia psidii MF-1]